MWVLGSGGSRGRFREAEGEVVAAPEGECHVGEVGLGERVAGGKNDGTKLCQGRSLPEWGVTEFGFGFGTVWAPLAILVERTIPPCTETGPWRDL